MHPGVLHLSSANPRAQSTFDFSHARWQKPGDLDHATAQDLRTLCRKSFLFRLRQQLQDIVGRVGLGLQIRAGFSVRVAKRERTPNASGLFHLLATRTLCARGKPEVCECATDGGSLRVLETRDSIDVAVTLSLRRPPSGRGDGLSSTAIDERLERDLAVLARDELRVDPALRKARV